MEITLVKSTDLKPAEYNPRAMTEKEYEGLKTSLEKFGIVDAIIVNKNPDRFNIVVGGHQRLRVAIDLGYEEVPVHYVDLDEEREKELNLRLNKNTGHWDYDALANYFDNGMLFDVGFSESELGLNVPLDDFNKSELPDAADVYLQGTIKQITVFLKGTDKAEPNDYGDVLARLDTIMTDIGKDNHTDTFLHILKEYENNRDTKKA